MALSIFRSNNEKYRYLHQVHSLQSMLSHSGKTPAQVAIRWLLQKDVVSSVIIGAKTLQQLEDNMGASTGWEITEETVRKLTGISLSSISTLHLVSPGKLVPGTTV